MDNITKAFEAYIKRTEEIRRLSTPSLDDISAADEYMRKLRDNFIRIGELEAGSGTHYAPWLPALLHDPAVTADVEYLLREGRSQKYQDMYYLLRSMHKRNVKTVK